MYLLKLRMVLYGTALMRFRDSLNTRDRRQRRTVTYEALDPQIPSR